MIVQGKASPLKLLPIQILITLAVLFHGNAILHRANQFAKVTANAFFFLDGIGIVGFTEVKVDGLMRSIFTGDVA